LEIKNYIDPVPPADLRWYVKTIYSLVADFSEEDFDELTEFIRCLWVMKARQEQLKLKRLELLHVLKNQNQRKIFEETQKLLVQLNRLESLAGSSPPRVRAESI
jgi:valyl-tRNA synthetase